MIHFCNFCKHICNIKKYTVDPLTLKIQIFDNYSRKFYLISLYFGTLHKFLSVIITTRNHRPLPFNYYMSHPDYNCRIYIVELMSDIHSTTVLQTLPRILDHIHPSELICQAPSNQIGKQQFPYANWIAHSHQLHHHRHHHNIITIKPIAI